MRELVLSQTRLAARSVLIDHLPVQVPEGLRPVMERLAFRRTAVTFLDAVLVDGPFAGVWVLMEHDGVGGGHGDVCVVEVDGGERKAGGSGVHAGVGYVLGSWEMVHSDVHPGDEIFLDEALPTRYTSHNEIERKQTRKQAGKSYPSKNRSKSTGGAPGRWPFQALEDDGSVSLRWRETRSEKERPNEFIMAETYLGDGQIVLGEIGVVEHPLRSNDSLVQSTKSEVLPKRARGKNPHYK